MRAFEGELLTREQAARLLSMWQHFRELTTREVEVILNRFDAVRDDHRIVRDEPSYLAGYHDGLVAAGEGDVVRKKVGEP